MLYSEVLCKDIKCEKCPFYNYECPRKPNCTLLEILIMLKINSYTKARLGDELDKEYKEDDETI